jgi:hypothetical protein
MRSAPAFLLLVFVAGTTATAAQPDDAAAWTVYVANDNCPDYTWGLTEEQTRQAFADIVRGHLDEMNRTDKEPPENRDRYNMAVTQEAICFAEKYPDRKDELIRRIKEGRVFVSPYLCNSLWGMASVEQTIRTFYPARRLERQWGIPKIEWAEHIEEPCLPWGTATILAGCGIRWLSNPFYNYDSTFGGLKNPPLFIYEGPDGLQLRVVMDPWASNKVSYTQGARVLNNPQTLLAEWLPHYRSLGAAYSVRAILASGTHGDINPGSGNQARGFAEKLAKYNASPGDHPKLVNATLPMFCQAVDETQARTPFLQTVRGDFGHSWDAWPVSLAKYAAAMREGERQFLAAEALLAVAGRTKPELFAATRADRERAEWCLAMLSDHAWNGTDEKNQRHNAELRKKWGEELAAIVGRLLGSGWDVAGAARGTDSITLLNSLSIPRAAMGRIPTWSGASTVVVDGDKALPVQVVAEEDGWTALCFVSPAVAGWGRRTLRLKPGPLPPAPAPKLRASPTELDGPFYHLTLDPKSGGVAGLVWKQTGAELVSGMRGAALCQAVYYGGGRKHTLSDVKTEVVAEGPVLARLKVTGTAAGIGITHLITLYADLDRVDFDVRISKPVASAEERLCHVFPVMRDGAVLRVETVGAVVRPKPQPEGDLLPGADARRLCVQGFVDASLPQGPGVTIVPLDAFLMRLDLEPLTFEALGNDQNYKEVVKDQNGVTEFRFRYSLRAHAGPYNQADAVAFSRDVATPLLGVLGRPAGDIEAGPPVEVDPARAIVTAFKPADDPAAGGVILRLWEISVRSFKRAILTDLLERDIKELKVEGGAVKIDLRPHGFAALRLLP